jgi:hypothetical protein
MGQKLVRKSHEGAVLHLICPFVIRGSKFIVDVLYRPSLAHLKMPSATRPLSLTHSKTTSLNFHKDSSNNCNNVQTLEEFSMPSSWDICTWPLDDKVIIITRPWSSTHDKVLV